MTKMRIEVRRQLSNNWIGVLERTVTPDEAGAEFGNELREAIAESVDWVRRATPSLLDPDGADFAPKLADYQTLHTTIIAAVVANEGAIRAHPDTVSTRRKPASRFAMATLVLMAVSTLGGGAFAIQAQAETIRTKDVIIKAQKALAEFSERKTEVRESCDFLASLVDGGDSCPKPEEICYTRLEEQAMRACIHWIAATYSPATFNSLAQTLSSSKDARDADLQRLGSLEESTDLPFELRSRVKDSVKSLRGLQDWALAFSLTS